MATRGCRAKRMVVFEDGVEEIRRVEAWSAFIAKGHQEGDIHPTSKALISVGIYVLSQTSPTEYHVDASMTSRILPPSRRKWSGHTTSLNSRDNEESETFLRTVGRAVARQAEQVSINWVHYSCASSDHKLFRSIMRCMSPRVEWPPKGAWTRSMMERDRDQELYGVFVTRVR